MAPDAVGYILWSLTLLYAHLCLRDLDAVSTNVNRISQWLEYKDLEPEPTRVEAFKDHFWTVFLALAGRLQHRAEAHDESSSEETGSSAEGKIDSSSLHVTELKDRFGPAQHGNQNYSHDFMAPLPPAVQVIETNSVGNRNGRGGLVQRIREKLGRRSDKVYW